MEPRKNVLRTGIAYPATKATLSSAASTSHLSLTSPAATTVLPKASLPTDVLIG